MTGMGMTASLPLMEKALTQSAGSAAAESVTTAVRTTTAGSPVVGACPGRVAWRRRTRCSFNHSQAAGSRSITAHLLQFWPAAGIAGGRNPG